MQEFIFLLFALCAVIGAGFVAFSKNIVHSAFALLLSFFGVAGLYVLLSADFIAATQVIVYIGGILVLILFGVMLTEKIEHVNVSNAAMKPARAWLLLLAIMAIMAIAIYKTKWNVSEPLPHEPKTAALGDALLSRYLLPFEVASVLLLVALVGAIIAGRREVKGK